MKKVTLIDTHTHTNLDPLINQFEKIAKTCLEEKIGFNIVGVDLSSSELAIKQARQYDHLSCSIGIHPTESSELNDQAIEKLELLISNNLDVITSIGECGLDYYHQPYNKELQKKFFIKQISLAKKYNKGLMMHIRNAHDDAIMLLKEHKPKNAIVHCFTDKSNYIEEYNQLDCYISFPGVITFKPTANNNLLDLYEAVRKTPLDRILVETDAPYLTPVPYRGKINYPQYVQYTLATIAKILNKPIEEMKAITSANARRAFGF